MDFTLEAIETPALTKAHLADLLFEQIGLNKRESKDMVDAFFDLICDKLVNGEDVKISGFGNFQIRTKAPRPGRNPRTGEAIAIQARRVVTFHASHKLKEQIQQSESGADGGWAGRWRKASISAHRICSAAAQLVVTLMPVCPHYLDFFHGHRASFHPCQALLHHR